MWQGSAKGSKEKKKKGEELVSTAGDHRSHLVRLFVGQEDVQHCLPAWLCRSAGIHLRATILLGFFAECDVHPRAPVSMLRRGIKEASGRGVLRKEAEQSVLKKGRHCVSSGRRCSKS